IMLLSLRTETGGRYTHAVTIGSIIGVLTLVEIIYFYTRSGLTGARGNFGKELINRVGHTELIGRSMFTDFLLPFEITSLLLLVAIIGAVILSKRKI
ncbi:NADH-quinone oxidoreductase subunit J, partial [bacterium]